MEQKGEGRANSPSPLSGTFFCPQTSEFLVELWPLKASFTASAPLVLRPSVSDWVTPLVSLGLQPRESSRWGTSWSLETCEPSEPILITNQSLSLTHTHTQSLESLESPNRIFTYCFAWSSSSCVCMLSHFSRVWFFGTPQIIACQVPVSTELPRPEYWSGLPCSPQGDLSNQGIKHRSLALQVESSPYATLNPSLDNFEHYFASMWNKCNCAVVWIFFYIAFLWDWIENWPFPVLRPLLSVPNLLVYWVQHFHSIIFWDWK